MSMHVKIKTYKEINFVKRFKTKLLATKPIAMGHGKNRKEENDSWKVSGISRKFPSYRNSKVISTLSWLKGKQKDDGAEGLWRINDELYDFTAFIDFHPGGSIWLKETQGTDITEPFESHHISLVPENIISQFRVRAASEPRNYRFTLRENGFYKTLKARVREKLKEIDYSPKRGTDLSHLLLLFSTLFFFMASARTGLAIFENLAALSLCWLGIAAHNYFHRRDNWQMYTFNLTLLNFANWRISHALSHHVYPNSLWDLEMSMFEPFLCWIPSKHYASKMQRIISVIIQPMVYAGIFPISFLSRVIISILGKNNVLYWHDVIGLTLPALMYAVAENATLINILRQWIFIVVLSSFIFGIIGLNAGHHDPRIHHDGDANRLELDWGLFQVDTIIDIDIIKGSPFLVLTHFGDHMLHHLFPTLDHGLLPQLYPILFRTLQEFGAELREQNQINQFIGQSCQLLRLSPNPMAPGWLATGNKVIETKKE